MRLGVLILAMIAVPAVAGAQMPPGGQMPDPKQMSGVPLPSSEIPAGTVTVRVVRGSLSNLVVDQDVVLSGDASATAKTNDAGRAEFTGLTPGSRLRATAVVDGERLESQEFTLPQQAGVRLMLVATDPGAAQRAEEDRKLAEGPARTGIVILGQETRFIVEVGDEGLTVFNVYQIVNTARTPVQPAVPIVFPVPAVAERTALLEGSSPQATLEGDRVTVAAPFAPGPTLVQFAYTIPFGSDEVTITQRLPAALAQLAVVVQKAGDMRLSSAQVAQQRDMQADGQTYILGQGPPLPAGTDVTFTISGLPHVPAWPRNVALGLAGLILAAGAYGAFRGAAAAGASAERTRLAAERERLFTELTDLEAANGRGDIDPQRFAMRRRELIVALERVYAALDETVAA
jgi:hypothetical protein